MLGYFTLNNFLAICRFFLDVACVWVVIYFGLKIVKNNSRTIQIFKGIILVLLVKALASYFGLKTLEYLADAFVNWGVIVVVIIFQPEIRSLLEKLGKTNVFSRISTLTINEREKLVDELVKACKEMGSTKTGALISLEQGHSLSDFIKTGTPMDSVVTSELLCSIFAYGTPLHDGAVILQGVKIACAAAYFPPTTKDLPTSYGARHRAAVGISEITDSITIVVSEETGNISIAEAGELRVVDEQSLRDFLMRTICQGQNDVASKDESDQDDSTDNEEKKSFTQYIKGVGKKAKKHRFKKSKIEEVQNEETEVKPEKTEVDHVLDAMVLEKEAEKEIKSMVMKPKRRNIRKKADKKKTNETIIEDEGEKIIVNYTPKKDEGSDS